MNRFNSTGVRLSIFCLSPTGPSVVNASTWVSPRWKSPVPCARGEIPVSDRSGRISVTLRPSGRSPSSMMRRRNSFSTNVSNASETSLRSYSSPISETTLSFSAPSRAAMSAFPPSGDIASASLPSTAPFTSESSSFG